MGGWNRLLSLVLCLSAWSCGADEGVRSGASLACGGRGVKDSPPRLEGEESGEGESSLKRGGIGMGGGVGLASDGG